jgi:nucleotide-binding universal stress UspA family protein
MARTILFPTDGSATAKAAGRFAADIAKGEGDTILVLAVAQRADFDGVEDEPVTQGIAEYLKEVADAEAAELRSLGVNATAEVAVAVRADEEIVNKATEISADAIVMGTHGRSRLARAVIGSTADRVVRHSDVPVILVPLVNE